MKAFSLIELIVVISLAGILFSTLTPNFYAFKNSLALNSAAAQVLAVLRLAQSLGESEVEFKSRGSCYSLKRYNLGNQAFEIFKTRALPAGIFIQNTKTIKFADSGLPKVGGSGTIILQTKNGKTRSIIVSSAGRIRIS